MSLSIMTDQNLVVYCVGKLRGKVVRQRVVVMRMERRII